MARAVCAAEASTWRTRPPLRAAAAPQRCPSVVALRSVDRCLMFVEPGHLHAQNVASPSDATWKGSSSKPFYMEEYVAVLDSWLTPS